MSQETASATSVIRSVTEPGRFRPVSTHQLGQDVFRRALPEDIDWEPFPSFPPSARSPSLWAIRPSPPHTWFGSKSPPA